MNYLIGTDEAGYGPNLGPLVISATVWQVPGNIRGEDLYERLDGVVTQTPGRSSTGSAACVPMADSKTLYRPGKGLGHLERGLWAALATVDQQPRTWPDVWDALAPESADDLQAIPWYSHYDSPVPLDADRSEVQALGSALREGLAAIDVRLLALHSRAVFPREFNELVRRYDSKGAALSQLTLELVARLIEPLDGGSISVVCDKHGGRSRYAPLLAERFPDRLIEIYGEGRQRSTYRFGPPGRRVEFCFRTKAESCLTVALASMASKYLRELAMRALNEFWCDRVAHLRPTAGYPQDARRFKAEIAAAQAELEIEDQILWRAR